MTLTGRILIIDDEPTLRQTLARILQRAGFEVTTAASGNEGLGFLARQPFDLIYLDIRMPDMTGLEVLKVIHAQLPETPVILFTAQPDLNSALEALRSGATDYLLKPLKPEVFIERTRTILTEMQQKRRKKEVQSQIESLQAELRDLESNTETRPASATLAQMPGPDDRYLIRGRLTLDLHTRRVTLGDQSVTLPPASFDYLLALARHSPNVVDYQTLVAEAQGYQADARESQELVKWHMHNIRQALEPDARHPVYIINIRGTGYRLVAD